MKWTKFALAAALAVAVALPATVHAAGYAIYEQGAAALGMAGAATASVSDPSAVFFNPANMTKFKSRQVYLGGNALTVVNSFAGVGPYPGYGVTEEMKTQTFYPPNIYAVQPLPNGFVAGFGFNSPFGLGIEWKNPATFTGRGLATKADVQGLNASLSVAKALKPTLSVALGADVMFARVKLHKVARVAIPGGGGAYVDAADVVLDAPYKAGYGWNAALSWQALPTTSLGLAYRSHVKVDVDGTADFALLDTGSATLNALFAGVLKNQDVTSTLRFPAIWSTGVAYSPSPAWTLEGDFNWTQWSFFTDLPVTFKSTPELSSVVKEDYNDQWQVRVGVEHRLPKFTYRFGYYFDKAAAPIESVTPLLPDADREGVALGLGLPIKPSLKLDVYDCALFVHQRSTSGQNRDNFNGVYKGFVNMAGAGLTWTF
jgi:long-chain fatty acid transport protein